jgi:arylsulfatase A-like enzyme
MSGKYPATTDLTNWTTRGNGAPSVGHLAHGEITIAEALKQAGYATGMVGKWHLGGPKHSPKEQGFDVAVGAPHSGRPWGGYFLPNQLDLPGAKKGDYLTDRLTDEGIRFIEANKDRPFFLYQSYFAVHAPVQGRPSLVAKHEARAKEHGIEVNAHYAAMFESLDDGVGRIMAKLEELELSQKTVVFFFSDNGGVSHRLGKKNAIMSNRPLRMGKGYLYEGGIREPLIVHYPPLIEAGGVCSTPVVSTDFYPTILEIAGIEPIPEQHADGVSIVPLLKDPSSEFDRRALFFHFPHSSPNGGTASGAIRAGDYKLIEFFGSGRLELYDLEDDIGETHDLSAALPDKTKQLHRILVDWRSRVDAKMPPEKQGR